MTLPTVKDVQAVDPVLTNMLVGYMQADTRFVAARVFPGVPVDKDSGTYYIFTKKYWFMRAMAVRAPGGQYARGNFGVETATYTTLQLALSAPIADEVRANSQLPMDLEQAAVRWLAQQSLIEKEVRFATDFMAASVWETTDNNSATDWDDFSNGDPVANILTARRTISNSTGMAPNTMVVGSIVHEALVNHPDIIDRMKHVSVAGISGVSASLASIFDLPNYHEAKGTYANINEADAFAATAIIDDDALICYVSPSPGLFEASAGYTFNWAPGGGMGGIKPKFRDEENDADLIKYKEQWDQKVVATDLGYIFLDIV